MIRSRIYDQIQMNEHFKPMLACPAPEDLSRLRYPVLATPKIDGIRCITMDWPARKGHQSVPVSRSLRPINNIYVYDQVATHCPPGLDGELVAVDNTGHLSFSKTSSAIMASHGAPGFKFMVFDMIGNDPTIPYSDRGLWPSNLTLPLFVEALIPVECMDQQELIQVLSMHIDQGYEGSCIRTPNSPYKYGRSTLKEQWLVKIKSFSDHEAYIVGFEELMHNANIPETSRLGYQERSSCQENLIPMDTLGALVVKSNKFSETFKVGTGFDEIARKSIWRDREKLLGRAIKFKYQPHGTKDRPRTPVFQGFRESDDL